MKPTNDSNAIFYMTLVILTTCAMCVWQFSGFHHQAEKFKMILLTFLAINIIQFILFTPIKFAIMSCDAAWWPASQAPVVPDQSAKPETLMEKLRLRLRMLRSELLITERHRHEPLNLKFRLITQELWLIGKLFLMLLVLILVLFDDQLPYYNTANTQHLFEFNHTDTMGLSTLTVLPDIYPFIEMSLINAFTDTGNKSGGVPWTHAEGTRLLGVVRLRQMRSEDKHMGLKDPVFDDTDYSEGWKLPYVRESYTDKFWQIYQPWVARVSTFQDRIIMGISHNGDFISYPEMMGYENLLSDTRAKSKMVLRYLQEHKWLDLSTRALFMDFSLFNADANVFSVCTLWLEQFPFGGIKTYRVIDSFVFLDQIRALSLFGVLVLFVFAITWLQFAKAFWIRVWYEPKQIKKLWTIMDALILVLSLLVTSVMALRDSMVQNMIRKVEVAVMVEFIDFREPARLSSFCCILEGFTVALVTMRLWKVLQFSSTFQLFTSTLFLAWKTLFWTIMVTVVFLVATGIAAVAINGNNTSHFSTLMRGIISLTCFAFGFNGHVKPPDLFYGGKWLGIVLYAILGFVVRMLLINIIVSMLETHMAHAKAERDDATVSRLTYCQFLRVEYAGLINFFKKACSSKNKYWRKNRTVAENIERKLNKQVIKKADQNPRKRRRRRKQRRQDEALDQLRYRERIERTLTLTAILQTQMELIERLMFGDEDGHLPPVDEDDDDEPGTSGQNQETQKK